MTHRSTSRSRALGRGSGRRLAAAALLLPLALTACGGPAAASRPGAMAIPSAPASRPPVTAAPGHAQLVAMGDAVHLDLGGRQGQITATGPDLVQTAPGADGKPPAQSAGTVTVVLRSTTGDWALDPAALSATDELGKPIRLTPDAAAVTATPGHDATLRLSGTFTAGHATLTWAEAGTTLATWDFEVELD
ncbi:hypothetical protein ACFW1A_33005 [Kitasatospora sp. NPDC058965]|uniref:hypothetical protein n=1 Tax=Kitasatospora sp. NPDC058965 TaxID=3346682 RepID=UPI0036C54E8A